MSLSTDDGGQPADSVEKPRWPPTLCGQLATAREAVVVAARFAEFDKHRRILNQMVTDIDQIAKWSCEGWKPYE